MNNDNPFSDNPQDNEQVPPVDPRTNEHYSEYDVINKTSPIDSEEQTQKPISSNEDFTSLSTPPQDPDTNSQQQPAQSVPPTQWQSPQQSQWTFNDFNNHDNEQAKKKKEKKPKSTTNKGLKVFAIAMSAVFILTLGLFVGYVVYTATKSTGPNGPNSAGTSSNDGDAPTLSVNDVPKDTQPEKDEQGKMTTAAIAKLVKPSVVGIISYVKQGTYQAAGQGSGIIMTQDGYILTNAHVVTSASSQMPVEKVEVVLSNGDTHVGKIVGVDTKTDIAVLKINQTNLTPATFGDSNKLQDGETVVAIGNPGGLQLAGSITQGIISSAKRIMIFDASEPMEYIQTDAAINPGNSGGALVNQFGQVVGINTAKISATDYEGIGFAIPISNAKPIVDSIIANGYVKGRTRIGITYQQISETLAQLNGIPRGLRVIAVDQTCDVFAKGVKKGDIITKIDGSEVIDADTLKKALNGKKPGDQIMLSIYRIDDSGKANNIQIKVTLEEDVPANK
ncbi:MAG: trypsin-like peptidase domain-containing protein [Oscillospiraceae bacterium]